MSVEDVRVRVKAGVKQQKRGSHVRVGLHQGHRLLSRYKLNIINISGLLTSRLHLGKQKNKTEALREDYLIFPRLEASMQFRMIFPPLFSP